MKNDRINKIKKFFESPENRLEALEYCYANLYKHKFICPRNEQFRYTERLDSVNKTYELI